MLLRKRTNKKIDWDLSCPGIRKGMLGDKKKKKELNEASDWEDD